MVSLMDRLLKLENLDLQLTPYRVLATGADEGMVEFVPSTSLAQVSCRINFCLEFIKLLIEYSLFLSRPLFSFAFLS